MSDYIFVNRNNVGGLGANEVSFFAHTSDGKNTSSNDAGGLDSAFHQARRRGSIGQVANSAQHFAHSHPSEGANSNDAGSPYFAAAISRFRR